MWGCVSTQIVSGPENPAKLANIAAVIGFWGFDFDATPVFTPC